MIFTRGGKLTVDGNNTLLEGLHHVLPSVLIDSWGHVGTRPVELLL